MKKVSSKKVVKVKSGSAKAVPAVKKSKNLKKSTAKAAPKAKAKKANNIKHTKKAAAATKNKADKTAQNKKGHGNCPVCAKHKAAAAKVVAKTAVKTIAVQKNTAHKIQLAKNIIKPKKMSEAERIEKLVIDNRLSAQKLGYSILRRWGVRIEKEELHSVIDYALCDSAIRYVPNKGASFPTYFYYHLRGHLIRLVADLKLASTTYAQLSSDSSDSDQTTIMHSNFIPPVIAKSELTNSPECLVIKEEELNNCSSSVAKLDKLEQAVLTRIYNNEPLTRVARSLGYSRCHVSRIKQQALNKLKAIYSHKTNAGDYSNVTAVDFAQKRMRSRNKSKLRLSSVTTLSAVA